MNKQILSPFDCDLCAMVEDLTGSLIDVKPQSDYFVLSWEQCPCDRTNPEGQKAEAIKQAVNGRLGTRAIAWEYKDGRQSVTVEYDPTEYPEEIRTRLTDPDFTAGQKYCRTLLEVDAIQVRRDNVETLVKFTGGGTMTTPRTPDGIAVYSFPDGNGIFIDAPEKWYIVREPNGRLTARPEREFNREFEPKGIRTVGNYDGKPARPSGSEIMETFNQLFGTDIDSRGATHGINAGERINVTGETMGKGNCPDTIPDISPGCTPDNRRPEKRCETCRYFNPQFPVNGNPAPVCLAIKQIKGGTEYTNPRGTQPHFRCSNGKYESRY